MLLQRLNSFPQTLRAEVHEGIPIQSPTSPHTLMLLFEVSLHISGEAPQVWESVPEDSWFILSLKNGNSTFATMASLAQGTDWAVEATQALGCTSSILAGFFPVPVLFSEGTK